MSFATRWTGVLRRSRPGRDRSGPGYGRLRGALDTERQEFESILEKANAVSVASLFWEDEVNDLLNGADADLESGRLEEAWQQLHGARRVEVYGLEAIDNQQPDAGALTSRAHAIREEAVYVTDGWRKRAVEELLGRNGLNQNVTAAQVQAASWILHTYHEAVHRKRRALQEQFRNLYVMGVGFGLLFLVLSILPFVADESGGLGRLLIFLEPPFPPTLVEGASSTNPDVGSVGFALFVGLAGIIGASLFGMRSLKDQMQSKDVTQYLNNQQLTRARALIGAISALFIYFLVQTQFVSGIGETTPAVMIIVGFAAGYSQRMVGPAVETVAGLTGQSDGSS